MSNKKHLCLKCKKEDFIEAIHEIDQSYNGIEFKVKSPAMECFWCGWTTLTDEQADQLCIAALAFYRRTAAPADP